MATTKKKTARKPTAKKKTGKKRAVKQPRPLDLKVPNLNLEKCPAFKSLDIKFQVFILEYLKDFNGARAAMAVGAPKKSARVTASEWVAKGNIQQAMAEVASQVVQGEVADVQELLQFWTKIVRGDITEIVRWDENNGLIFTKSSEEMDPALTRLVKKIKVKEKASAKGDWNEVQTSLELHDPLKASELLAKHHGMLQPEGKEVADGLNNLAKAILEGRKRVNNGADA